ncbi:MAG TPA: XTP/dITP diphosphatase [Roseiflexaceae bacterium]|nr:XTP/dITP diphosphatase [Roseiflexaceae bacterium]
MTTLVIATTNAGKLREYAAILADLPILVRSLADMGISDDVEETGATFAENAQLKAEFYAARTGCAVLADDSGLEVDALGGEPGVFSHRYAGPHADDADRNRFLLAKLQDVPQEQRTAQFICVIALARPGEPVELVAGRLPGTITMAPRGEGGFGYDPLFYVPAEGKTLAELPAGRKNQISHRARAAAAAHDVLARWFPPA